MRRAQMWFGGFLIVSCAACGSGYEGNAFLPSPAFIEQLKVRADRLAKSEQARFNNLELATKGVVRYERCPNPKAFSGGTNYKEYRDYTAYRLIDIRKGESYLYPIVISVLFEYRLMATTLWYTDDNESFQKAQKDTEYKPIREDSVTIDYRCNAAGELVDPLPGLMPRDSAMNQSWNKFVPPGQPLVSPVETASPNTSAGNMSKAKKQAEP